MPSEPAERVYRFEPVDTSGIFLGLGVLQCAFLGTGLLASVVLLTGGVALPIATVPVALGACLSFARVGGRPLWEWVPLFVSWGSMRLGRGERWFARLPLLPARDGGAPDLPAPLSGLSIVEVPWRGALCVGAVRDSERSTLTAIVPVQGPEFVVQPRSAQDALLSGWADVLNQFAAERTAVTHIGWSDFTRQSGLHEHRAWLGTVPLGTTPANARASYDELLTEAAAVAASHETVVSITVSRDRVPRRVSLGADPDAACARALCGAVEGLLRAISSAGLSARDPLDAASIARLLRVRIDPAAATARAAGTQLVERLGLVSSVAAGPTASQVGWRHLQVDGAWHRTYWIASWPRLPVGPAWLEPFLAGGGVTRTMTVIYCPVSTYRSRRRIERDLVKLDSDAQTKQDKGRRVDARHRRATQALLDREDELVAGYAEMTYLGLVSVAASSEAQLEEQCEVVEQLGREAGLDLRALDGRQDLAWAAALPLGLAPRSLFV